MSTECVSDWQVKEVDERQVLNIMQCHNLPEILARLLVIRGLEVDMVASFMQPKLRNELPDPFHLIDMEKAIIRIIEAIKKKEKVVIYGDYDVDGATSSALLKLYFAELGFNVELYVPDRLKEGYGPNIMALSKLKKENKIDLCIMVDCGTVAYEPLKFAKEIGLDAIVIDHHMGTETRPEAVALVNPNRFDQISPCGNLAAVGVVFLLLIALNATLRNQGFFSEKAEVDLIAFLDLVSLGTVCDVMKLRGLNRAFVSQGLKIVSRFNNIGIRAMVDILNVNEQITVYHLGFLLGPNINAGGRVGKSDIGARLLSSKDLEEAKVLALQLYNLNEERKALEGKILSQAMNSLPENANEMPFITVYGHDWHPGVIGIVASRLKEKFNVPIIVITIIDGIGKASARSVKDIDIGAVVLMARAKKIIIEGGGHKMAAGFSIEEGKIKQLKEFIAGHFHFVKPEKMVRADAILSIDSVNFDLYNQIAMLQPFGVGNPEPSFIIKNCVVKNVKVIKNSHISCILYDRYGKLSVRAIAFNCMEKAMSKALLNYNISAVFAKIKQDVWRGSSNLSLILEDAY